MYMTLDKVELTYLKGVIIFSIFIFICRSFFWTITGHNCVTSWDKNQSLSFVYPYTTYQKWQIQIYVGLRLQIWVSGSTAPPLITKVWDPTNTLWILAVLISGIHTNNARKQIRDITEQIGNLKTINMHLTDFKSNAKQRGYKKVIEIYAESTSVYKN